MDQTPIVSCSLLTDTDIPDGYCCPISCEKITTKNGIIIQLDDTHRMIYDVWSIYNHFKHTQSINAKDPLTNIILPKDVVEFVKNRISTLKYFRFQDIKYIKLELKQNSNEAKKLIATSNLTYREFDDLYNYCCNSNNIFGLFILDTYDCTEKLWYKYLYRAMQKVGSYPLLDFFFESKHCDIRYILQRCCEFDRSVILMKYINTITRNHYLQDMIMHCVYFSSKKCLKILLEIYEKKKKSTTPYNFKWLLCAFEHKTDKTTIDILYPHYHPLSCFQVLKLSTKCVNVYAFRLLFQDYPEHVKTNHLKIAASQWLHNDVFVPEIFKIVCHYLSSSDAHTLLDKTVHLYKDHQDMFGYLVLKCYKVIHDTSFVFFVHRLLNPTQWMDDFVHTMLETESLLSFREFMKRQIRLCLTGNYRYTCALLLHYADEECLIDLWVTYTNCRDINVITWFLLFPQFQKLANIGGPYSSTIERVISTMKKITKTNE